MGQNLAGAILAAGTGERLRAAVAGTPKPLVELGGETLLALQARAILDAGASSVVAVVNSETAGLIAQRKFELPPQLELAVRDTANSMETLFAIGERLRAGRFLLATVDAIVPRAELRRFVVRALELTAPDRAGALDGALGVVRWRGDRRPLFASIGPDGLIQSLGSAQTPDVTAGVYLFSTAIFRFVGDARAAGLSAMREFLAMAVKRGMRFAAIELAAAIDVDEAADLEAARALLAAE
jgi:choline kinase